MFHGGNQKTKCHKAIFDASTVMDIVGRKHIVEDTYFFLVASMYAVGVR